MSSAVLEEARLPDRIGSERPEHGKVWGQQRAAVNRANNLKESLTEQRMEAKHKTMKTHSTLTTLSLLVSAVLLSGCVSPQVTTAPQAGVNLRQFKTVKLTVTDAVNTAYSREGTPMFEGLLKGQLQSLGYTATDAAPEMTLDVRINRFDPGDRALRLTIGFGAGRSVLEQTATFKDASGQVLAEFRGGKSFTGLEHDANALFTNDDAARMGMIAHAVRQIGDFIKSNGRLESR